MSPANNAHRSAVAESSALLALVPEAPRRGSVAMPALPLSHPLDFPQRRSVALAAETVTFTGQQQMGSYRERLDHPSVVMTLDTYSHVLPSMQRAASEKLENLLSGKSGTPLAHQPLSIQLSKSVND